jgi:TetR/AcrR family fatty acid metabolism transcriptional regulator
LGSGANRIEKNNKYHQILEAAVRIFARQGFHQSTIAQIAKEAGVADGTIYLYFKNKDDILVQFFSHRTKQVFESFREEVDRGQTSLDKLRNLIKRHLTEFVEQGQQEGQIRKDLYVGLVKRFIIGAVDEVINTWLHSNGEYDLVSMTEPLVDLFIKGIGQRDQATG